MKQRFSTEYDRLSYKIQQGHTTLTTGKALLGSAIIFTVSTSQDQVPYEVYWWKLKPSIRTDKGQKINTKTIGFFIVFSLPWMGQFSAHPFDLCSSKFAALITIMK